MKIVVIGGSGLVYSGLAIADKVEDFKHPRPFIEESPAGRRQLINLVNMLPLFFFLAFFVIIIPLFLVWGKILGGQNERAIAAVYQIVEGRFQHVWPKVIAMNNPPVLLPASSPFAAR